MADLDRSQNFIFSKAILFFLLIVAAGYALIWGLSNRLYNTKRFSGREKVAIVRIEGVISQSDDIIRQLKMYGDDDSIKGILLRINTPGGGVGAAQEVYKEVLKSKKKIFASMGGVAASGGYYIACAADKIVANPGTITGSIGVIMAFSNMEELLKKIGLKSIIIKSGKHKDIGVPTRELTEEEKRLLQEVSDDIHDQFIEAVAKGRNMKIAEVRAVADGRIFSGRQALEAGLIDFLGNQEDAIAQLSEIVGITGTPNIVEEKKPKSLLYKLISGKLFSDFFPSTGGVFLEGANFLVGI